MPRETDKTDSDKPHLLAELAALRQRVSELEQREAHHHQVETTLRDTLEELKQAYDQTILYAHDLRTEIAERKRIEDSRAELEQQLHQAQKLEAIGRLAGGIAHDFNNLLTAIIGFSDMAVTALPPDHPASSDIGQVQKTARRAADLTRQLLAFARRQSIQPEVLNLNDLVLEIEPLLRRLIAENIDLIALLRPDVGLVKADARQIEQVLLNFVVNARDAMPEGGKLIIETANITLDEYDTRSYAQLAPGKYVKLSVTDTGTGMTEEVKTHLFEPFFTTKEVGQGTGLGLAIVHGIVDQNGGQIKVDSQPGHGTTFEVYLPQVLQPAPPPPASTLHTDLVGGTETVLLAEDEEPVRALLTQVLSDQGYTVLVAVNGTEALQLAHSRADQAIDLLVTDWVMPGMGGAELADRLQTIHPTLRVLFISGYTDNTSLRQRLAKRGDDFLAKPFTPYRLIQKVRAVLDGYLEGADRT